MKILTALQIKEIDCSTMERQNISSWELMERAATKLTERFTELFSPMNVYIAVGKGGNGGDGLAMARMLTTQGFSVHVLALFDYAACSDEYCENFRMLPSDIKITYSVYEFFNWIEEEPSGVVVDAIFGIGYTTSVYSDDLRELIQLINDLDRLKYKVVAIDTPSGMGSSIADVNKLIVCADHTFTIYSPKLPMLMPLSGECAGEISIIDIGYDPQAIEECATNYHYTDNITGLIPKRKKFAYKANFGSLLIIGGGQGMFGASIIAARGAEAVGCGAVTIFTPRIYEPAVYANIPTAMIMRNNDSFFATAPDVERYSTVCVGMGLGKESATIEALSDLFLKCNAQSVPMVIDADALNLIAENIELRHLIPEGSVLTPHVGEFRRLVGSWSSDKEKLDKLISLSDESGCTVVLKGANSAVASEGDIYFNSSGNPSMSRAASGDMLAGIIAAMLARGLSPLNAARVGVFLHGSAADRAKDIYGENFVTIDRWLESFYI
ncbi:MAG: NAD(P)H-hydrate dehydratase [Rikenellaceae bacterium]